MSCVSASLPSAKSLIDYHKIIFPQLIGFVLQGIAEMIGTFLFVFCGIAAANAAVMANSTQNGLPPPSFSPEQVIQTAIGFGIGLAVVVAIFFRFTGGVFNPAITLSLFLVGAFPWTKTLIYIGFELIGSIFAAWLVQTIFPTNIVAPNKLQNGTTLAQGILIEMMGTWLLCLTVLMLAVEKGHIRPMAPLFIGLIVFVCHCFMIPFTNCSINPARSFGPAVISGYWTDLWIFFVGPFMGSVCSSMTFWFAKFVDYEYLNGNQDEARAIRRTLAEPPVVTLQRPRRDEETPSTPTSTPTKTVYFGNTSLLDPLTPNTL